MNRRNKDLIDFVDSILGRYNATPDEWEVLTAYENPTKSKEIG